MDIYFAALCGANTERNLVSDNGNKQNDRDNFSAPTHSDYMTRFCKQSSFMA